MSMSAAGAWWPSRYGEGDELGTLNEITPARVANADMSF